MLGRIHVKLLTVIENANHKLVCKSNIVSNFRLASQNSSNPMYPLVGICWFSSIENFIIIYVYILFIIAIIIQRYNNSNIYPIAEVNMQIPLYINLTLSLERINCVCLHDKKCDCL
jgi:hypothetical protein